MIEKRPFAHLLGPSSGSGPWAHLLGGPWQPRVERSRALERILRAETPGYAEPGALPSISRADGPLVAALREAAGGDTSASPGRAG